MPEFGGGEVQFLPEAPKVETLIIKKVSSHELDRVIQEAFGLNYTEQSIEADFEWSNDSQYEIRIDGLDMEGIAEKYGQEEFDRLKALRNGKKVDWRVGSMAALEYLSNIGIILPGTYTVEVAY